jgi:hypothetical protein
MGPDDSEATRERLFAIRAMNGDCPDIWASPVPAGARPATARDPVRRTIGSRDDR